MNTGTFSMHDILQQHFPAAEVPYELMPFAKLLAQEKSSRGLDPHVSSAVRSQVKNAINRLAFPVLLTYVKRNFPHLHFKANVSPSSKGIFEDDGAMVNLHLTVPKEHVETLRRSFGQWLQCPEPLEAYVSQYDAFSVRTSDGVHLEAIGNMLDVSCSIAVLDALVIRFQLADELMRILRGE